MFFKRPKKHEKTENHQHSLRFVIVTVLSSTLILCVVGSIVLTIHNQPTPDLVTDIAQSSFATLTGMVISHKV